MPKLSKKKEQIWSVYLLVSPRGRTYVGSTTDPDRRLRQHNREILGGARATGRESSWKIVCYVSGFPNRSSACRFEALTKKRARGLEARNQALVGLAMGVCPSPRRSGLWYIVPTDLQFTSVTATWKV